MDDTLRFDPQAGITNLTETLDTRRRGGRVGLEDVYCDLGPVLDLSSLGLRTICRKIPESPMEVTVRGVDGQVTLQARVAWSRKAGFRKHEIGVEFLGVSETDAKRITKLGMTNRRRTG